MDNLISKLENITDISDEKNIELVKTFLNEYTGNDWKQYVKINEKRYNRFPIFQNKIFDVLIITWNINQKANVHDHPNACIFKVLEGNITV